MTAFDKTPVGRQDESAGGKTSPASVADAHTATPWVMADTTQATSGRYSFGLYCDDATGSIVAQVGCFLYVPRSLAETEANAKFIVRAVNHHEELVNALRALFAGVGNNIRAYLDQQNPDKVVPIPVLYGALQKAAAVLRSVEGK